MFILKAFILINNPLLSTANGNDLNTDYHILCPCLIETGIMKMYEIFPFWLIFITLWKVFAFLAEI